MKIDPRIERHVRQAYGAVATKDGAAIAPSFEGLSSQDSAIALGYGLFVVGFIVNDVLRDGVTDEALDGIARRAAESTSSWIDLGARSALVALMRAASKGDASIPDMPVEDLVGLTFVLGGYLLQAYRLDGQHWWEYLDDIWAQAEAMPDPAS